MPDALQQHLPGAGVRVAWLYGCMAAAATVRRLAAAIMYAATAIVTHACDLGLLQHGLLTVL